jgi:tRNA G37 N-methylase Trm5
MIPKAPKHNRMKRRNKANQAEKTHMKRISEMQCLWCGAMPVQVHHVIMSLPGKRTRKDHRYVAALCRSCHFHLHDVVGDERKFWEQKNIDIEKWCEEQWRATWEV